MFQPILYIALSAEQTEDGSILREVVDKIRYETFIFTCPVVSYTAVNITVKG
jgi:hypothetical protein